MWPSIAKNQRPTGKQTLRVDVSVLIVSYRTRGPLTTCLGSLFAQTQENSFEVFVIDNNSNDGTIEVVANGFPQVTLLRSEINLGFARAINLAARLAQGDFLLLLNPDTQIIDQAVDRLVAFARSHPGHGVYGGRTVKPSGELAPHSCLGAPSLWSLTCFGFGLSSALRSSALFNPEVLGNWQRNRVREVPVVTGGLFLVPRVVWTELGGFDPVYFMYCEDTDLCVRAARLGYRPLFTPEATVVHEVGASSASNLDKAILLMRGKATFLRRNWNGLRQRWGLGMLLLGVALRAAVGQAGLARGRSAPWKYLWQCRSHWLPGYLGDDRDRELPARGA